MAIKKFIKVDDPPGEVGINEMAVIPESELSFDTGSGHDHDGVNSKLVSGAGGGATFTASGATVVNAQASPTSWTDLDLSGTVGSNSAFVILAFTATGDMDATAVRMNGDAYEYYDASAEANAYGCALGHHESGASAALVLMCVTDTNGVIEWITESSQTATVKLIAYIK